VAVNEFILNSVTVIWKIGEILSPVDFARAILSDYFVKPEV